MTLMYYSSIMYCLFSFLFLRLVVITIILIELHAQHFKVVVFCWKPFHGCFDKFGRNWSASDSFIHAFASLIFLSFASLTYDARDFFVLMKIHAANHVLMNNVPLVYPSLHPYTPILYFIIVCVLLLFVGVVYTFSSSSTPSHTNVQGKTAEVLFSAIYSRIEHFYGNISKSFQGWL